MPLLIVGCLRRKTTSGEAVHGNEASFAQFSGVSWPWPSVIADALRRGVAAQSYYS